MPLPEDFSPWEHLQSMLRLNHNKLVREYFRDVGGDDWEPDLTSTRGQLRIACTLDDNDTSAMTMLRMYLFYEVLGYGQKNLAVVYGSKERYTPPVTGHPRVILYFSQDRSGIPKGYGLVDAEMSFRLMKETEETFTPAEAETLGRKIKEEFTDGGKGIQFTKGKDIYAYYDKENGYRLKILCTTESDAIDVIQRCLRIQNIAYNKNFLSVSQPKKTSNPKPGKTLIYGKQREKRRYRPIANVRFRYAICEIPGLTKPVALYDTTQKLPAIVF
ncbi:hypothetical protein [Nostoc sp. CMAA1605]|uniref:hypothetical protein n=1 Tax=Nostoc sp. CMAA1605 TaxID=2055159 RepID=UPI001F1889B2|nr:hypothetical protein [Nostoc sp. CMAA1605]MCF4968703.1 hypothetical protein [Nostoc sp. CMAA1605]